MNIGRHTSVSTLDEFDRKGPNLQRVCSRPLWTTTRAQKLLIVAGTASRIPKIPSDVTHVRKGKALCTFGDRSVLIRSTDEEPPSTSSLLSDRGDPNVGYRSERCSLKQSLCALLFELLSARQSLLPNAAELTGVNAKNQTLQQYAAKQEQPC
jgi:hypothetical protein